MRLAPTKGALAFYLSLAVATSLGVGLNLTPIDPMSTIATSIPPPSSSIHLTRQSGGIADPRIPSLSPAWQHALRDHRSVLLTTI